jgi:hypothetical protein
LIKPKTFTHIAIEIHFDHRIHTLFSCLRETIVTGLENALCKRRAISPRLAIKIFANGTIDFYLPSSAILS